jgi:hypothetical protein
MGLFDAIARFLSGRKKTAAPESPPAEPAAAAAEPLAPSEKRPVPPGVPDSAHPANLHAIDHQARVVHLRTLVFGAGAGAWFDAVHETTTSSGARANLAGPDETSFIYLDLLLGEVRGYQPHVHLYGFDLEPGIVPTLQDYLPHIDGCVLAPGDRIFDAEAQSAARLVGEACRRMPYLVFGAAGDVRPWLPPDAPPPIAVVEPEPGQEVASLKPMARALLQRLIQR